MSRVLRVVPFACLILLGVNQLTAQTGTTSTGAPVRDGQAVAAVQRAVVALGGAANLQIHDAVVQGTIQIVSETPNQTGTFVWKDDWNGNRAAFRREFHQGNSTDILVSGNGNPANSHDGQTQSVPFYISYSCAAFHLPGVILAAELADNTYNFHYLGSADANGLPVIKIQTSLSTNPVATALSTQIWYFDAASGLPVRMEYRVASVLRAMNYKAASVEFSKYSPFSGTLVPVQMTEHGLAGEEDIVTVTSVNLNGGTSASDFLSAGTGSQ